MKYQEILEMVSKLFMVWSFEASSPDFNPIIEEAREKRFICNVLSKRLEAFDLPIIIPDYMSLILETCTGANPGKSLLLAYLVVKKADSEYAVRSNKYVITPDDFSKAFPFKFPITVDNPKIDEEYAKLWDEQKDISKEFPESDNKIDYPEYWLEAIYDREGKE